LSILRPFVCKLWVGKDIQDYGPFFAKAQILFADNVYINW